MIRTNTINSSDGSLSQLPYAGEFEYSPVPRFKETVLFVHHFAGSKKTVQKHSLFLQNEGFNTVRFNLLANQILPYDRPPITGDLKFGVRHVWADQIENLLNLIPGRKIIYSFSMPSNSALMAIAHRRAGDVAAWICDGGPFLNLPFCFANLYREMYGLKNPFLLNSLTRFSLEIYGRGFPQQAPNLINDLPNRFPILSIRGDKDPLVPETAIQQIFAPNALLALEILRISGGKHLDGLKNHADVYKPIVKKFITAHATPIDPVKA